MTASPDPRQSPPKNEEPGPRPADQEDAVDLTLIRWALTLEPIDRLRFVERMNASIAKLRALNAPEDDGQP